MDTYFVPIETGAAVAPLTLEAALSAPLNNPVRGAALVAGSEMGADRNGHGFLKLTLRLAGGGMMEARWWRFVAGPEGAPAEGAVWHFTAQASEYHGQRQLTITAGRPAPEVDAGPFERTTRRPLGELLAHYEALVASLDAAMAALVRGVMTPEIFAKYQVWPAAQKKHAAVRHGLLAHSVLVAETARNLARTYGAGGLPCDESLVIAACLLHDVGKVATLAPVAGAALPEAARTLDHVTRGALLTQAAWERATPRCAPERLENLIHAIMAHHRQREWGSPIEPHSVEAALLHTADYAEAFLWGYSDQEG